MSEVRQRWRIVFARGEEARFLSHLDAVRSWERAFRRGDIPVATSEGFSPRPKLVFAAPLQLGMLAEHELADLFLAERLTAPDLRDRLAAGMPSGYRVVDLHDVWMGAAALAPRLVAADYRMTLLNVEPAPLESAVGRLMDEAELPRERRKESRTVCYDLRPLILNLAACEPAEAALAADGPGTPAAGLRMRLRHSQNLGSGRPDEVVAALAAELGMRAMPSPGAAGEATGPGSESDIEAEPLTGAPRRLEVLHPVRERLWLDDEL
jgi:radical SAM-linked protein